MAGPFTPFIPLAMTAIKGYAAKRAGENIPGAAALLDPKRWMQNKVIDQLPEYSRENARKVMDAVTDPVGSAIKAGGRAINNKIDPDLNDVMDRQTAMNKYLENDSIERVENEVRNRVADVLPSGIGSLIRPKGQYPMENSAMTSGPGYSNEEFDAQYKSSQLPGFEYNESPVSDMPENADMANYDMDSIGSTDFKKGGRVKARKPAKRTTMSTQSSASKRGDGIAQRGKTRGRYI